MSLAISPVSNTAGPQAPAVNHKPRQAAPKPEPPQDTVQLSSAAQLALQEATETQAQTAREAAGGDLQAGKLLARDLAAAKNG